jgi:hypothetical protein
MFGMGVNFLEIHDFTPCQTRLSDWVHPFVHWEKSGVFGALTPVRLGAPMGLITFLFPKFQRVWSEWCQKKSNNKKPQTMNNNNTAIKYNHCIGIQEHSEEIRMQAWSCVLGALHTKVMEHDFSSSPAFKVKFADARAMINYSKLPKGHKFELDHFCLDRQFEKILKNDLLTMIEVDDVSIILNYEIIYNMPVDIEFMAYKRLHNKK